jgi:peptide/nickel transport system permease protein
MGKKTFVVRRLGQIVVLYFLVATMLFVLFKLSPGDPIYTFVNLDMSPEQVAALREAYGLDDPIHIQYVKWLIQVGTFNFGVSYAIKEPVMDLIGRRIFNTFILMNVSLIVAYLIALPLGSYIAWNRGSAREQVGVIVGLVSRSAPVFWTGLIAIWLFSLGTGWFPSGGMKAPTSQYPSTLALYTSAEFLHHLMLPAIVQGFYYFSLPMLLMRNSMLDVLNEDYVEFAALKGIGSNAVMIKHAARTAMLPIVTAFATGSARAVGLSVVIETVFAIPGLGRLVITSIGRRDYPVIQGIVLVTALVYVVVNLIVDMTYTIVDPRVRY